MFNRAIFLPRSILLPSLKAKLRGNTSSIYSSAINQSIAGKMFGLYDFPESRGKYEVSTAEWEYVERLLPIKSIPKPIIPPGTVGPSGWKAPSATRNDYPYFVKRNANHMTRVYMHYHAIMQRTLTYVCGIEGDIFLLGDELKKYLLERSQKRCIILRVHQAHSIIIIKGDFVNAVKEYLLKKGF